METFVVSGGKKLIGEIEISGSKNSAVALVPAALLIEGTCTIGNVPYIKDIIVLKDILDQIGVKLEFIDENTIQIDSTGLNTNIADTEVVKEMRASYYLMGALLGRFQKATVPFPGGCDFGSRPIDQHVKGFEAMGAVVTIEGGLIKIDSNGIVGASVYLDMPSVGATINIMLAATTADGITTIENAAKEPHIVDLANFLNAMGAKVTGAGTDIIKIRGVEKLEGGRTYYTIPDQIEAGTYMIAAAVTDGDVKINNLIPKHMESLTAKMVEMGVEIEEGEDYIHIKGASNLKRVNIKTLPYPGFPSDLHPQMAVLLGMTEGHCEITEEVWPERFQYVNQLKMMGAKIEVAGNRASIHGKWDLSGAPVKATDLRAGIAMVLAGLVARGKTKIANIHYIDRGYENMVEKMRSLGADIERCNKV